MQEKVDGLSVKVAYGDRARDEAKNVCTLGHLFAFLDADNEFLEARLVAEYLKDKIVERFEFVPRRMVDFVNPHLALEDDSDEKVNLFLGHRSVTVGYQRVMGIRGKKGGRSFILFFRTHFFLFFPRRFAKGLTFLLTSTFLFSTFIGSV